MQSIELPESRPLLMVNHNAKAGGGSILNTIREFKPCEIKVKEEDRRIKNILRKLKNKTSEEEKVNSKSVVFDENDCFVHIKESRGSDLNDRVSGFIIGSIREPCSHFVSWWSWKSNGGGGLNDVKRQMGHQFLSLLGRNAPYYNSTIDIKNFQEWVYHPAMWGQVGNQFRNSYGVPPVGADCFVVVEDFSNSLLNCLQMYEQQGGFVNWTSPLVAGLVRKKKKEEERRSYHCRQLEKVVVNNAGLHSSDKNDPLFSQQLKHHASCTTYFNPDFAHLVENGPAKVIYEQFGYMGCCSKEFNRSTIYTKEYLSATSIQKHTISLFFTMFCSAFFMMILLFRISQMKKPKIYSPVPTQEVELVYNSVT